MANSSSRGNQSWESLATHSSTNRCVLFMIHLCGIKPEFKRKKGRITRTISRTGKGPASTLLWLTSGQPYNTHFTIHGFSPVTLKSDRLNSSAPKLEKNCTFHSLHPHFVAFNEDSTLSTKEITLPHKQRKSTPASHAIGQIPATRLFLHGSWLVHMSVETRYEQSIQDWLITAFPASF